MAFLIGLLWILAIGLIVVGVLRSLRDAEDGIVIRPLQGVPFVLLAFGLMTIAWSMGEVPAGYRGVVTRFGAVTGEVKGEGLYWITPFIVKVERMDVQVQASPLEATAASKDLQDVLTVVTLNWYLDPGSVASLYQKMRRDYGLRIIQPAVQEAVKASTARFNAEQLITERATVRDDIRKHLAERLGTHGIMVDGVQITEFKFSDSFAQAIEAKVTQEQRALEAENKLREVEAQAKQQIELAKAQAEAIRIQASAINAQGGEDYVKLKAIEKWNGAMPEWITPSAPLPFIGSSSLGK